MEDDKLQFANKIATTEQQDAKEITLPDVEKTTVIMGKRRLVQFLKEENIANGSRGNYFREEIFRKFVLFLAGYRPNVFISPVQCALYFRENLLTQTVGLRNFYNKRNSGIQNMAKSLFEFLSDCNLQHRDVDFGNFKEIYLTMRQMHAIGSVDEYGDLSPKRQLITGSPGSGISILLLIKMFILGQLQARKEKTLYYKSRNDERLLDNFISLNREKFIPGKRVVKVDLRNKSLQKIVNEGADAIILEAWDENDLLLCLSPNGDRQIVVASAMVCDYYNSSTRFNLDMLTCNGVEMCEMRTMFRTTIQIQQFLQCVVGNPQHGHKEEFISGHHFSGVKIETWIFDRRAKMTNAVEKRVHDLINVDHQCKTSDIGIFINWKIADRLNSKAIKTYFHWHELVDSPDFAIAIVVEADTQQSLYLAVSRAMCHCIIFSTQQNWNQTWHAHLLGEMDVYAKTIYAEARGESVKGQEWVAWVIKNRAEQNKCYWGGSSIKNVCLHPGQFQCWNGKADVAIDDGDEQLFDGIKYLALRVNISSRSDDPTHGADHYCNPDKERYPSWVQNCEKLAKIGRHQFYRVKSV